MEGARRYAQCRFVDMSDLQRFMLEQVRYIFYYFAKARSIGANIKTLKFHWKYMQYLIASNFLLPAMDHNFHDMMLLCQNHS